MGKLSGTFTEEEHKFLNTYKKVDDTGANLLKRFEHAFGKVADTKKRSLICDRVNSYLKHEKIKTRHNLVSQVSANETMPGDRTVRKFNRVMKDYYL